MSFHERPKGPKHPLVDVIRPGDPMFDRLMNYRYYRLQTRRKDMKESLLYLHRYQKSLDTAMKDCKFDGSDPIMILEFLTRYVEETDKLGMTEAQAFALVPNYLSGEAKKQVRSNTNSSSTGGISCWVQFVDHMLREYATPSAIQEAISCFAILHSNFCYVA